MRRAARFTTSPITVYVRRYAGPMSPANSGPRGSRRCGSAAARRRRRSLRSASSIRSVSPSARGAPAVRISLPPSRRRPGEEADLLLVGRRLRIGVSSTGGRRRPPPARARRSSPSVPSKRMNAIEICRCSGVPPPARTCVRTAVDRQCATASASTLYVGISAATWWPEAPRFRRNPGPFGSPRQRAGMAADLRAYQDLPRLGDVLHPDRPGPSRARSRPTHDGTRRRGRSDRRPCARRPTSAAGRASPAPRSGRPHEAPAASTPPSGRRSPRDRLPRTAGAVRRRRT